MSAAYQGYTQQVYWEGTGKNKASGKVILSYKWLPGANEEDQEVLVLLHDFLSCKEHFDCLAHRLPFRVLAIDLPGHGDSSAPKDQCPTDLREMATGVAALLEHLGVFAGTYLVGGHGGGFSVGLLVARLAAEKPKLLVSLEGSIQGMDCLRGGMARRLAGMAVAPSDAVILREAGKTDPSGTLAHSAGKMPTPGATAHSLFSSLVRWCEYGELADMFLAIPAVYLYGAESGAMHQGTKAALASHHDAHHAEVPGGHWFLAEKPEEAVEALGRLLTAAGYRSQPRLVHREVISVEDIPAQTGALLDNVALPCHQRTTRLVLGRIVGSVLEDNRPQSLNDFGFNLTVSDVPSANWNALHLHRAPEIFMAYKGEFEIQAGTGGHSKVRLQQGDFVVAPPKLLRSFKCASPPEALPHCEVLGQPAGQIATFLLGAPWVQWARKTIEQSKANGAECDDFGGLGRGPAPVATATAGSSATDDIVPRSADQLLHEMDCTQADLESITFRARDQPTVVVPWAQGELTFSYEELTPERPQVDLEGYQDTTMYLLSGDPVRVGDRFVGRDDVFMSPAGGACRVQLAQGSTRALCFFARASLGCTAQAAVPMSRL